MSDDVLVRVDNVSKRFCRSLKRSLWYGLQDLGSEIGGRRHGGGSGLPQSSADVQLRPDEFWAVKDVSFELRRGECLGLIGRNGAGKTTLLRMLNGLIKPDTGSIEMNGRVGALIALGAGFNPILSGRDNIYVNGSVLGLSKAEIDNKLEEIIDFAEIGEFIDMPVQNYSSGMSVRLGFAVASSLNPDVILADEILAVGDTSFRAKCFRRFATLLDKGVAVIFVSHDLQSVQRLCQKSIWLRGGKCKLSGDTSKVLAQFEIWATSQEAGKTDQANNKITHLQPNIGATIVSVQLNNKENREIDSINTGDELRIRVEYEIKADLPKGLSISVSLRTGDMVVHTGHTTFNDNCLPSYETGKHILELVYPSLSLGNGFYIISVALMDGKNIGVYDHNTNIKTLKVVETNSFWGRFYMPHTWVLEKNRTLYS
jgi:ABC-type polysaccharide/polyol phosphate transport system ATPase subunit